MNTHRGPWQPNKARSVAAAAASPLQLLQRKYRAALSGAVVAKARYLAQVGEAFASAIAIDRARWRWQRIEACRARLAREISTLQSGVPLVDHPQQRELRV